MEKRRYALIVENEIFDIIQIDGDFPFAEKWKEGFSKNLVGIKTNGDEQIGIGSTWDGEKFNSSSDIQTYVIDDTFRRYVFVADNCVFGAIVNHIVDETYEAAFATGVTGKDITDFPYVKNGWVLDGDIFKDPRDI